MNATPAAPPSALSATPRSPSAHHRLAPGTGQTGRVEKDRAGADQPGAAAASSRAPSVEKALANDAGLPRTFVVLVVVAALTVTLAGVRSMQAIVAPDLPGAGPDDHRASTSRAPGPLEAPGVGRFADHVAGDLPGDPGRLPDAAGFPRPTGRASASLRARDDRDPPGHRGPPGGSRRRCGSGRGHGARVRPHRTGPLRDRSPIGSSGSPLQRVLHRDLVALHGLRLLRHDPRTASARARQAGTHRGLAQLRGGHPELHGGLRGLRPGGRDHRRARPMDDRSTRRVRLGGPRLRDQLHPQHRVRHRRHPARPDRAARGWTRV